jgi:hypothetical protein
MPSFDYIRTELLAFDSHRHILTPKSP